ncbi:D-aminoacyl-tRNA deacylase [Aureitalea marina]|uniref:D-aminoacyl-tRNA deacylase n=1 Tax=Aureitalea marina TaxID=930804 RepID=A0A2S7KM00_9FLAO|nr:D-aminoacyl-tRNA deacylase [Aureitalea marina]PQB03656.1 D-tyrosyl-tRNA(Tyr) deacylase [Aureitalea marina]
MRVVIQRVSEASVEVDGKITGQIDRGLLVLLGIETSDTEEDALWLAGKIVRMRIFGDESGHMNLSVADVQGNILVVSQFTLHAQTKKGNRPSFIKAARPEQAKPIYNYFIHRLEDQMGKKISTGEFGAMMNVQLINDGPVTITMDSKLRE